MAASDDVEQAFTKAVALHQQGDLAQAERLYRQILQSVPHHLDALNLLGMVAIQTDRNALAVELIGNALALNDRVADFHNNIGEAFRRLGELDRAARHFARATELEPTFLEAQQNLADVAKAQGKLDQAAAIYTRILSAKPDSAAVHGRLAEVLALQGKPEQAIAHFRRAATISDSPLAYNKLGIALREHGMLDDAIAQFRRAVSLKEDFAQAHNNLGNLLRERGELDLAATELNRALDLKDSFAAHNLALVELARGRPEQALALARRALESQQRKRTKALFVRCLKECPPLGAASDLRPLLLRALSEPWARPNELVTAVVRHLNADPAIGPFIERTAGARPDRDARTALLADPGFPAFAADELLQCLLTVALVADMELERVFTGLRAALLMTVREPARQVDPEARIGFFSALARQCFINDYVYAQAAWEREQAEALRGSLDGVLRTGAPSAASSLIALACYVPLHSLPSAHLLLERRWPAAVNELLTQQVREPSAARQCRASLPRLTAIDDAVSLAVRRQYEDNPYPSWTKIAPADEWPSIGDYVRTFFPLAQFEATGKPDSDILVAGCGTGQQSIETAGRFPHARVLAVDLSLASLSYARVKTAAAQVKNLDYAQADLLRLGAIGRTFDMIEATGVLHHLDDPMRGWRVLLSLLRPMGFMRVGLYSRLARADVRAARDWIARRGYHDTPDDIRRCRQEMIARGSDAPFARLTYSPDFASTSACRDLLFHVHERQLGLDEIGTFLADENLAFLGFEIESPTLEKYRARFPDDTAMTDLGNWHLFETENPDTFGAMYQFWIHRRVP